MISTRYHVAQELPAQEYKRLLKNARVFQNKIQTNHKKRDYSTPESALSISSDKAQLNGILRKLTKYTEIKHVVVVGIGGSALGTQAVYEALKTPRSPSLLVLDSLEYSALENLKALLQRTKNPKHIALVVVSKSGLTAETVCNASVALSLFERKYGLAHSAQTIVIGDAQSPLLTQAKKKKILTFTIPEGIGGRYSVFTAVGIVPLTLLGIDVRQLYTGASDAITEDSLSFITEATTRLACMSKSGIHTLNFFTFNNSLTTLGFWYRQLLAESLGKDKTIKKQNFMHQLHPTVSTSVDLHSLAQLYLSGFKGVYTRFIEIEVHPDINVEQNWISELIPMLNNKSFNQVKDAISKGVCTAYTEASCDFETTVIDSNTPYNIGYLMAQYMYEVTLLCNLFNVNAFNQPSVELYKKHMRNALK